MITVRYASLEVIRHNFAGLSQHLLAIIIALVLLSSIAAPSFFSQAHAAGTIIVSPPALGAATCSTRFSSQDVWPGFFYEQSAPAGSPTLTQRINALNLDIWRVQAVGGFNDGSNSLVFPAAYTGTDGHSVSAWNFVTLDKVLADGTAGAPRLLDLTTPPDVLYTGTGPLPSDGTHAGALIDQTYGALATYYANIVRYFRAPMAASNSGSTVTYTATTATDTATDFTAYGGGSYSVTATVLDTNGFPDWETAVITSVTNTGHTLNFSGWSRTNSNALGSVSTPAAGAAYNVATTTPPITSPVSAKPWPRPPSVGDVSYYELFNESDLSNSFFPRSSPTLPPPTPTLSGVNVAGGTLTPGTTYAYRIAAVAINTNQSLAGTEVSLTLPAGMNAVQVNWSATTNLGLSPFAYRIYGRTAAAEKAMLTVGKDAAGGLTFTDKGSIAPSGALPAADNTGGLQIWRPREYTKMWNVVAPAIKAVDASVKVVGPVISNPQSLAPDNVVTTAVTTGPADTSWQDSTDYIPYLMAHGTPAPDVVSFHAYGNFVGSSSTDASYFSGLASAISDYKAVDAAAVGSVPAWITETNIDAGFLDNIDYRAITQLGSAWLADEMIQMCQQSPSVQELFQFEVANTNTWNLFGATPPAGCYPQPACLSIQPGEPNIEYWLIYWLQRYFPAGSSVAPISGVPAGYAAFAAQAPGSTKITVVVANLQTGASPGVGTAGSVTVQLSGASSSATDQLDVNGSTSVVNGPTASGLGAVNSASLSLPGYGVSVVSFDTGAALPDTTPPSVPAGLHSTATTSSSISLAWNASSDNAGGSGLAGYKLYRDGSLLATIPVAAGLTYTDTSLGASTTYTYAISAYDLLGNESARSSNVPITTAAASVPPPSVIGDCNNDGHVTVIDLSILLSHYGGAYAAADFNHDSMVNVFDLSMLLSNYGR